MNRLPQPPSALVLAHLTPSELQTYSRLLEYAHLRATSPELARRYTPIVIQIGGELASIENRKCTSAHVNLEELLNSIAVLRELEGHVDDSESLARHLCQFYGAEIVKPEDVPQAEAAMLARHKVNAKHQAANVGAPQKRG